MLVCMNTLILSPKSCSKPLHFLSLKFMKSLSCSAKVYVPFPVVDSGFQKRGAYFFCFLTRKKGDSGNKTSLGLLLTL